MSPETSLNFNLCRGQGIGAFSFFACLVIVAKKMCILRERERETNDHLALHFYINAHAVDYCNRYSKKKYKFILYIKLIEKRRKLNTCVLMCQLVSTKENIVFFKLNYSSPKDIFLYLKSH